MTLFVNRPDDRQLETIRDNLETLHAIEMLEYHNRNYLAFDNAMRSESKMSLLKDCIDILGSSARNHCWKEVKPMFLKWTGL